MRLSPIKVDCPGECGHVFLIPIDQSYRDGTLTISTDTAATRRTVRRHMLTRHPWRLIMSRAKRERIEQ